MQPNFTITFTYWSHQFELDKWLHEVPRRPTTDKTSFTLFLLAGLLISVLALQHRRTVSASHCLSDYGDGSRVGRRALYSWGPDFEQIVWCHLWLESASEITSKLSWSLQRNLHKSFMSAGTGGDKHAGN